MLLRTIVTIVVIWLSGTLPGRSQITDPIPGHPGAIPRSSVGVQVHPYVFFPNSQGRPARLNILQEVPDGTGRLFINDQRGALYVITNGNPTVYLDYAEWVESFEISGDSGQQGFTYFCFDPEFARNGIFYTVSSERKEGDPDFPSKQPILNSQGAPMASSHHDVIRRWQTFDPSSDTFDGWQEEMMRIEQPYADHNTGQLGFNPLVGPGEPDYGMLYIALADGGSDGFPVGRTDPLDNGQDLATPLGALLRIDPMGTNAPNGRYGIPADNPFVGQPGALGEVYAYGLRNPHRFSWDTAGRHRMFIVDIGQWYIEEINLVEKGGNYGWGAREGIWRTDKANEFVLFPLPEDDAQNNFLYPVAMYAHPGDSPAVPWSGAGAIAGGYVYRGRAVPQLVGKYVFADFSNIGKWFFVHEHELEQGSQTDVRELSVFRNASLVNFRNVVGQNRTDVRFGVDGAGEIYASSKQDGTLYRLLPRPSAPVYSVSPETMVFGSEGGSGAFSVGASGTEADWGLSSITPDWIEVVGEPWGSGDGALPFTVSPNTEAFRRIHRLILAGQEVTVIQEAVATAGITLEPEEVEVEPMGGIFSVAVNGTAALEWLLLETDWVVPLPPSDGSPPEARFQVLPNLHGRRQAQVHLAGVPLTITQAPYADPVRVAVSQTGPGQEGHYVSAWFGSYRGERRTLPWIHHEHHGWLYLADHRMGRAFWAFDRQLGWWYTADTLYPFLFSAGDGSAPGEWLFFWPTASGPRWFWRSGSGIWLELAGEASPD